MIIEFTNTANSSRLLMSEALLMQIETIGNKHYPLEIGGLLLGIKHFNYSIVVDFELPQEYKNGSNFFERGVSHLNQYLSKIYESTDSQIQYLGEWHTHPDGSTKFSQDDFVSIKNIAHNNLTNNPCPYLLIFQTRKKNDLSCYQFTQNELIKLKRNYE